MKLQESKPAAQQPYAWGTVILWVLFAFSLGFAGVVEQRRSLPPIDRSAVGLGAGIMLAILAGVVVGIFKYFKRNPIRRLDVTEGTESTDKYACFLSVGLAFFFLLKALTTQNFGALTEVVVCGLLGIGVKNGSAASRWILAVYAFIGPFVVALLGGSGGVWIWPWIFFAVCRSIVAHQRAAKRCADELAWVYAPTRRPCLTPILSGLDRDDSAETRIKANLSDESKTMPPTQPTINPIVAPATEPKPSQSSLQELEDRCYAQIAQELETNTVDKGVWTKAYAQAGGDDKQTRALYIKTRFDRLIAMEDARLETIRMNQSLERQKRIQQCESLLSSKGYKLIPKANGWLVKEPLGGRQPIETLEELEHYANSRQES